MSNRVLLGKIDSSDYGLIVSKEGVDVTTANEDELIFDSRSKGYGQVIFKETITLTKRNFYKPELLLVNLYQIQR